MDAGEFGLLFIFVVLLLIVAALVGSIIFSTHETPDPVYVDIETMEKIASICKQIQQYNRADCIDRMVEHLDTTNKYVIVP